MAKVIRIADREIGEGKPVFIIAEAGVNHNGDIALAKKLVDAAADAGADAVKFQTFTAENLVTKDAKQAAYQTKNIGKEESQHAMLKRLELPRAAYKTLVDHARKRGIIFLSTPFDEEAADFLDKLGVPAFKIGSSDTNNLPMLEHVAKKGKPIILSTGMSDMEEVKLAARTVLAIDKQLVILQCTTNYPADFKEVNLRAMQAIAEETDCLAGYSDHTLGIEVDIAAAALGACLIEKHFTLDRTMDGPDHKASLEPIELKRMVDSVRHVEQALGRKEKVINPSEAEVAKVARKSLCAKTAIRKGETLTTDMIMIKRPGTGIPPTEYKKALGKKAKQDIKEDEVITWSMLG